MKSILLVLAACGGKGDPGVEPPVPLTCVYVLLDEAYCEPAALCCDEGDCTFLYEDQQFACGDSGECDEAADALISAACDF